MEQSKKAQWGWVMFDWANSAYSLVISTAIFPVYFLEFSDPYFQFGSVSIANASVYAYSVSIAYLLVCFLSPLLSGIADYGGHRKLFMRIFTTMGSFACMSLFFFDGPATQILALSCFMLATASHASSLVFYDSYLNQLVPANGADKLSARGYAFGYIGSVILMCLNIAMIQKPELFGILDASVATRIAFLSVGIWWISFSQLTFIWLPSDKATKWQSNWITKGYGELSKAWNYLKLHPHLKRFLLAFFFYSAGVQTVVYLASSFAKQELRFETGELIVVILLLQLVAIGGAYLFAFISKKTHNFYAMKIMILIWVFICLFAYFVYSQMEFYFLATMVGLVLGGIQAISRSSYSKMLPKEHPDMTCFFSFYDVVYYVSIVFGTFLFGFINQLTQSMRLSVLALMAFFAVAFFIIRTIPNNQLREE
ncbi:MAG: MFS transporter [Saprospiraceae bacterium]|nr:MFS transporter [Saprospiraceae bacterium]